MTVDLPLLMKIETLQRAGDLAGAHALLDEGLRAESDADERGRLLSAKGRIHLDAGENEAGAAAFGQALELLEGATPHERAEVNLDLGRALRRMGELDLALEALEKATELFGSARHAQGRRRALAARGKVLYAKHDWKGARGAFRAALDQTGDDPPAWRLHHAMARAYEKDGRRAEADTCLQRARQAGWDGLSASGSQGRVSADRYDTLSIAGGAAADLTASASDSLVDHDDESELMRAALSLDKEDLVKLVALTGALNSALAPEPLLHLLLARAIHWSGPSGATWSCAGRRAGRSRGSRFGWRATGRARS